MKEMKKLLCLVLVLGLVFTSGMFSFAEDDLLPPDDGIVFEAGDEDLTEPEDQAAFFVEEAAVPMQGASLSLFSFETAELVIKSVEVLSGGSTQILYRDEVYQGRAANGEDPAKYYTTRREINLKDPRIFNVEFTVPAFAVSDPDDFLNSVHFTYGGFPLNAWGNGNNLRGATAIMISSGKTLTDNEDGTYTVSAAIRVNNPWSTTNSGTNIPYSGYGAGTQGHFGTGQTADNRAWWQAGPAYSGTGMYELAAVADEQILAATDLHIGPYDDHYSWIEMNKFAQSLIKALNGSELPIAVLNEKPIGNIAKGYIKKEGSGRGGYVQGDPGADVYVEVNIIGYGLTDNYKPENANFNNYSRFNAQWNIVVAYDESTVDDYLNYTVPTMNNDPQALIDKYTGLAPEEIDMVNVFYQNNVHSDEVTGSETMIKLIDDLIDGGKAGKMIPYKTYNNDDINFRYRVGSPTGTTHQVSGGYNGTFAQGGIRQNAVFDTGKALDSFIFVSTLCSNPDGKAGMRRVNRYGLDMNRDVVFSTQPETISLTKDIAKWDPLVLNEWHGYVQEMLIEPCTAPHAPTFEYDLMQNNMIQLAYQGGLAITASTGFNTFHVPWDHQGGGAWDDGGTIYAPMFAMLLGTYGYTIEFPFSNQDALIAGDVINYAMINSLLYGNTAYYDGHALNRALPDINGVMRDSHAVDNKYASMRKSSVMNKLEFKLRGIENIDSMDADKYFIDRRNNQDLVVGRPRPSDGEGGTLSFFPDYLIIPTDSGNQYNVAEAIKALNHTMRLGAKVSKTTADVVYQGNTYPAGTYVYDMKQGTRNLVFEIMGKGYDATGFASMYADIYCNYPDVRGFDSVQAYNKLYDGSDLFAGKLEPVSAEIAKYADISGSGGDYIVFKSNSVDAVRFVNLLLSGRSSGPSYSAHGDVWMLKNNLEGVNNGEPGTKSDYVIKASDLSKIDNLVDNIDLGLQGCHIVGAYLNGLPKEAAPLVEPIISTNSTRSAQAGGNIYWALDDYLGFNMTNPDGTDYNGSSASTVRLGANVVLMNNATASGNLLNAIRNDKLGFIMVQSAATLTNANFGTGGSAPSTGTFTDIALNGTYNINDSLFTANYANTSTLYARGNYFTNNIPSDSKILFTSLPDGNDAFIGGWQNTGGSKVVFGNRTQIFSTILKGGGIEGKPVQSLTMGMNLFNRSHYQKHYPMLATAIFAGAAGILDDQKDPVITAFDFEGSVLTVSAADSSVGDSGLISNPYDLFIWNAATQKYDFAANNDSGEFELTEGGRYLIVVTDWADNETSAKFAYLNGTFFVYDFETSAASASVKKLNGNKNDLTVKVTETFFLDGAAVFTRDVAKTFSINNNAADTYNVDGYKIYVDTKGNDQIRACEIIQYVVW